jgi:1,4-alpha-glucan branching enzyme
LTLSHEELDALSLGRHADPFRLLGVQGAKPPFTIRALVPGAEQLEAFTLRGKPAGKLRRIHEGGVFEGVAKIRRRQPLKYHATRGDTDWWLTDPYSFGPVLGPIDDYLMGEGEHLRLFDKMGAHLIEHEGVRGTHFAVWAPNASRVSLVGDFNDWDGRRHVMRRRIDVGVWEIFIPDFMDGHPYKYLVTASDGRDLPLKADPFAFRAEYRPSTASITTAPPVHVWGDQDHRAHWANIDPRRAPVSIYEVHAGSWRRASSGEGGGAFLTWDELADQLIPYVVDLGFTHIEFLPISEHPLDASWGYQTIGLYAPSARFGDPEGFARFVDGAHRAGVGVILDWVPAHFPTDAHGLARFDGTALYEHEDPRLGHHPDWQTAIYNFGRREVSSFLVNNALFWAERYHVDGLRVDAVASMLYRDYSRKAGEWLPNAEGGRENWEAVEFLRRMNRQFYGANAGVFTIAEESTTWPGVSKPVHAGGLGFGFKWNMGFMHDTLQYMSRDPVHRAHHHNEITFGLTYAFSENFVLPLSHDEVVHGKGSLLTKMSGDDRDKFANLRAYYALMWGYPGKKLLFMGQEFAQRREWSEARALDWELLGAPAHEGVRALIRDLNSIYRSRPALHARDCEPDGFEWSVVDDSVNSVFAWIRRAGDAPPIAVVANLTPVARVDYRIALPHDGVWTEILNTDARRYGGSGQGNLGQINARDGVGALVLPPLSTIMFEYTR